MPGSAREEAERLVAAILARTSAGGGASGDAFGLLGESVAGLIGVLGRDDLSTGSAECCVCPVCKAIAAVRDPSPETAERLAASAGDIASGVAGLMRAFSSMAAERPRTPAPRSRPTPTPDQAWSSATRVAEEPPTPDAAVDPWGAASAADAREAAAAARSRATAAEEAVARAVAQAKRSRAAATSAEDAGADAAARSRTARAAGAPVREAGADSAAAGRTARAAGTPARGAVGPVAGGSRTGGDVWAMATSEVAAGDAAGTRSVDHELGASASEDRESGQGDDARPGAAV